MLTRVDDLERCIAAYWPLAQDVTRSAYPTYTDGIKTRDDFAEKLRMADASDWGTLLLHDSGALVLIEEEDAEYVSLRLWAKGEQSAALEESLAYLQERYPGRTLWMGFAPENTQMLAFARAHDFRLLDDLINWTLRLADASCPKAQEAVRVTRENYPVFRALWTDTRIYWNADRIWNAFDRWLLFVTKDGCAAAACMDEGVMMEAFGFQYAQAYDEQAHRTLLSAMILEGKARGAKHLTYFSDHAETAVMQMTGFRRVSDYVCYEYKL